MRSGSYLLPIILATLLHVVVVALLAQSWFEHEDPVRKVPRHVQAQIVDLKTQKAQAKQAAEAKARKKAEQRRKAEAEKKRIADQKRKAAEKKKQQEIAKKKAAEKKRQQEIAKKKAAEKKKQQEIAKKKKADAEKKRLAEQKKQKEIARKKAEAERAAKAEADKKRKAEEEKAKRLSEAKRKLEAAAAEKRRNEALQKAMEEEEAAMRAEEQRASAMSYEAYIVDQITRNWRRSPSARNGMVVEVTVHLLPSGRVNDRYVSKSSGDSRFDNDALRAIDRVAVFEKLQDMEPVVFDRYFRKRVLRFRPEDLRD
ncbi:cell envelope integrity protein TolA [Neptuniibacter sp.]|uniref:cell envelope integrity protein TolA n=1 Tax=Neptuniibacter sp. TaxID=1962643 RepID=UPI0026119E14|nr:cell envelope integrity protein TolA [Neptuniibacter sp.]MCP4598586.1 cell envelope integrity protein TolA [Neptuniibacter sp.]